MIRKSFILFLLATFILPAMISAHQSDTDSLAILWTSSDPEVFNKVVYPYALNSKKLKWWKNVTLIIWGPSSKMAPLTDGMKDKIADLKKMGVVLKACKWCSDKYGVSDKLKMMGFDIKYMGKPLTEYLKKGHKVLTF